LSGMACAARPLAQNKRQWPSTTTSSCTCHAERPATPRGGSSRTTRSTATGSWPGSASSPTAAGRLPFAVGSYGPYGHSEVPGAVLVSGEQDPAPRAEPAPGARPRYPRSWICGAVQARSRNRSSTRTPKRRPSTATRSSIPWNIPEKSSSGGSLSGLNPKHRTPSWLNHFASVPADKQ